MIYKVTPTSEAEADFVRLAKSEPKVYAQTQTLSLAPPSALRGILVSGSSLSFV